MRSPSYSEAIKAAIGAMVSDVHTAIPAKVESYDAAAQTVDVTPAVDRVILGDEKRQLLKAPLIAGVPVCFPRGGGFMVTFPIKPGDFVLLVFAERSIDQWFSKGGSGVDPIDPRTHALSDAMAIPGVFPATGKLQSAHADHMVIGPDTPSGPRAYFKAGEIALGGESPSQFVALATDVLDRIKAIHDWALAHGHPAFGAPAALTVPPLAPSGTVSAVAATKVKAL
jgi:hypothetical protein